MPRYYPVCLEVAKLPCLVVGGGPVGLRKARMLVDHGATVTVVAPRVLPALKRLADRGRIALRPRRFRATDLRGKRLVFVATDDEQLSRRIVREAHKHGLLVNVADVPELCDFILPSIVRRGQLMLTISTEGACPAYAKRLRKKLEMEFDRAHADYVALLGQSRRDILARVAEPSRAVRMLERLLDEDLLGLIRRDGVGAAKAHARTLIETWVGELDNG